MVHVLSSSSMAQVMLLLAVVVFSLGALRLSHWAWRTAPLLTKALIIIVLVWFVLFVVWLLALWP